MSKLNVDQKAINALLQDKKSDFVIPDYQRPYAWTENECQVLWDDLFNFAFPENDYSKFDNNDEYFLGPIVTYMNDGKLEVIDGQQRLTTLMLLLRAFYNKFAFMQDKNSLTTKKNIEQCLWKTDEFETPDMQALKIDSKVATDNDNEEFMDILRTGEVSKEKKSRYADNYRFFQKQIDAFLNNFPSYFAHFPNRIIKNCILLPIEAESQDTALRIFSTLNDRGKPLSDADIFKAQLYKYYSGLNQKDDFICKWKDLEELCEEIFHPATGTPMDELFTRYMYYERAKSGNKSSTVEALRKFYEKNGYSLLKNGYILGNLIKLAHFWKDIDSQNSDRFSDAVLKRLYILNYAPNSMWTYFLSVYFMDRADKNGLLEEQSLLEFLDKTIAFTLGYAITNPGVNAQRTPVFAEMINLVNNKPVTFNDFKFNMQELENAIRNYNFYNRRPITKSMLAWWLYQDSEQELIPLDTGIEIEHIYSRNRAKIENSLHNERNMDALGNKALLEKKINIRASDYKFTDKARYYNGTSTNRKNNQGTHNIELRNLAQTKNDFTEYDITDRNNHIISSFLKFLVEQDLAKLNMLSS